MRAGKFSANLETGQYGCWSCNDTGNAQVFLRKLWGESDEQTQPEQYRLLSESRGLLYPETLMEWELVISTLTLDWLLPSYNADGKRNGLYRWLEIYDKAKGKTRRAWLPTPGTGHGLIGRHLYSSDKSVVYLCEGVWDGMILWETLKSCRWSDDETRLIPTANVDASLLGDANVLVIPACSVFFDSWTPLFEGKVVYLMAQNDHEHVQENGKTSPPASFNGMKRIADKLVGAGEVHYCYWGEVGFTADRPHGYDVRDWLLKE